MAVYLVGGATAVLLGWRESTLDQVDAAELLARGLVEPGKLRELFAEIEPRLHRYPAIDPPSFRKRLEEALGPLR